jgi:hypothetical protein
MRMIVKVRRSLTLSQHQPLGNERFNANIEKMRGSRRAARPCGRPRFEDAAGTASSEGQAALTL